MFYWRQKRKKTAGRIRERFGLYVLKIYRFHSRRERKKVFSPEVRVHAKSGDHASLLGCSCSLMKYLFLRRNLLTLNHLQSSVSIFYFQAFNLEFKIGVNSGVLVFSIVISGLGFLPLKRSEIKMYFLYYCHDSVFFSFCFLFEFSVSL